jgi:hypothetical protein
MIPSPLQTTHGIVNAAERCEQYHEIVVQPVNERSSLDNVKRASA